MRSVRVVKNRYYLYGLLSGFLFGFGLAGYIAYAKIVEQDSFEFLSVWLDTIKIDFSLYRDFLDDFKEFLPLKNLFILFILLLVVLILVGIILSFRRALFTKVEKFSKDKINKNH
jgi:ABC-type antimicrobial peptide transport system permease subunit